MIFLLTYSGKKRWNYTAAAVVRAASKEEALREAVPESELSDWDAEAIDPEGETICLVSHWIGDPG